MFDLEQSIQNWLKSFAKHQAFDEASIHEMELHIRDHIEDLITEGASEKEAFDTAVSEFGTIPSMAEEEFSNHRRKASLSYFVRTALLKNYYLVALRKFIKHKNYFLINISGLSIGVASFAFIALFIIHELSYDRFHAKHERTYRVTNPAIIRGEANHNATTSDPLAKTILANYPEVQQATQIRRSGSVLLGINNQKFNEERMLWADQYVFDVFDFNLISGSPKTVLANPRSLVLTKSYAAKYFGAQDPLGQFISVEEDSILYMVTGIVEDIPANSHIKFDLLGSLNSKPEWNTNRWIGGRQHTYVVLPEATDIPALEEKMQVIFYENMAREIEYYTGLKISEWEDAGNSVSYKLTPIADIHLKSVATEELEASGNIRNLYVFGLIGVAILFIAIFNFINLATAHSSSRAKEVGVRKVIGSTRNNLIHQFIVESIVVSIIATVIGGVMVFSLHNEFELLIGRPLAYSITSNAVGIASLLVLGLFVGIIAGCYPAFVLAAFKPIEVLKGKISSGSKSGWLRSLLVTVQFAASIIIIIGTSMIYQQLRFMLNKNLGFEKEQLLVIERPDWLGNNIQVFKQDLLSNSQVKTIANSSTIPGKHFDIRSYRKKGDNETFLFLNNQVSYDYLDLMGLELVEGRFFSKEFLADSNAVIINETAAKMLGYDQPIGKHLTSAFKKDRLITIVGVIKDHHVQSLHNAIQPISIELEELNLGGYIGVRLLTHQNVMETMNHIDEIWNKHSTKPLQYFFFDEEYQSIYEAEASTGKILIVFSSLSIFIACLGLIGLITYTTAVKQREIGIRKVLGAGSGTLVKLLSQEIFRVIIIATLVAWPLAYFGTNYWLENFADRVEMTPWVYVGATAIVTLIVGFTISFQTIKAALSNPVESLRQE